MAAEDDIRRLRDLVDRLEELKPKYDQAVNSIIDGAQRLLEVPLLGEILGRLSPVPMTLQDPEKLRALLEAFRAANEKLGEIFGQYAAPVLLGPWKLWKTADRLMDDVHPRITKASGVVNSDKLASEEEFFGPAAKSYAQTASGQRQRVGHTADLVEELRTTLQSLALSLAAAYVALLLAIIGFIATCIAAAPAVGSGHPVAAPAGLATIMARWKPLGTAVATCVTIVTSLLSGAAGTFSALKVKARDSRYLDGGKWPSIDDRLYESKKWEE